MAQNYKKLLTNIYFLAKHHRDLNERLMNDLSRDDELRAKELGSFNAYGYIVQMVNHSDSLGQTDYKKIHKMVGELPYIYT